MTMPMPEPRPSPSVEANDASDSQLVKDELQRISYA